MQITSQAPVARNMGSVATPTTLNMLAGVEGVKDTASISAYGHSTISSVGGGLIGAGVGGSFGYYLGGSFGPTGAIVGAVAGAAYFGQQGYRMGFASSLFMYVGSSIGGAVGAALLGPVGS